MQELELQARVINELQLNTPSPEIAAKFDISLTKVTRIKNKYETAVRNNTVDQLLALDQVLINTTTDKLKTELSAFSENLDEIAEAAKNKGGQLATLDESLITTANIANNKLRIMISSADTAGELLILIEGLTELRNSFFNKNVTQVNIQNNNGVTPGYDFGSDMPGVVDAN